MMSPMMIALLLALAASQTAPMAMPAPVCPATPAALPADLAGWVHGRPVGAATKPASIDTAALQPGVRADVTLVPSAQVSFALTPQKTPASGSFSGMLGIAPSRAGTYRIALGAGAWVNVVGADGKALTSTAHGHGPDCSGIRKFVDFTLQPGRYVVQIEGNSAPTIGVMLVAKA